jgi:hypothetical protein
MSNKSVNETNADDYSQDPKYREMRKKKILDVSQGEGIKYGIAGFIIGGLGTVAADASSEAFRKYLSASAKAVS